MYTNHTFYVRITYIFPSIKLNKHVYLKKYTFYQKDLLTLVRTNLYLSYGQVKANEFD